MSETFTYSAGYRRVNAWTFQLLMLTVYDNVTIEMST